MSDLPPLLLRSITADPGTEMARHPDIIATLGIPVYFCDSHAPWQRGSNENANGLLRQYFQREPIGPSTLHGISTPSRPRSNGRPRMVLARPFPGRAFRRVASLAGAAIVATLTGTALGSANNIPSYSFHSRRFRTTGRSNSAVPAGTCTCSYNTGTCTCSYSIGARWPQAGSILTVVKGAVRLVARDLLIAHSNLSREGSSWLFWS